ncbi:MAG: DeoR/GlpR family DNA-binding transcription regulator [Erysipelotrichaceae bacterium]|nr:DeoR/GlpR family DNA-binding transcription regulator [Erysipelotrichaceae bacterium]MDY5252913.1 DeoR/GlpR family DNA-binding transcription regulator [Erysipelotrichaceae bacterium]
MKTNKEIVNKRRNDIMHIIQNQGYANVENLAHHFNVSCLTIRRDLQFWEEKGAIEKYYGGAKLVQNFVENDYATSNEPYKHAIAKFAAQFVEDGDTIFINTSSTALLVIKYIRHKKVTIITNNAKAIFMDHDPAVTIVLTGGELRIPKESMVGDFALNNLQKVNANKSFLGCSGICCENGMSTAILQEVSINETMVQRTKGKVFILADATKIGITHKFNATSINNITHLITDKRVDDTMIDEFKQKGIQTYRLDPIYPQT